MRELKDAIWNRRGSCDGFRISGVASSGRITKQSLFQTLTRKEGGGVSTLDLHAASVLNM